MPTRRPSSGGTAPSAVRSTGRVGGAAWGGECSGRLSWARSEEGEWLAGTHPKNMKAIMPAARNAALGLNSMSTR